MNYNQFVTEWKDAMVYQPNKFDFDEDLNEHYIEYKESQDNYGKGMSVKEWCEFFFVDFDLDTHPYMLKEKAIKKKHGDGLRKLASQCYWNKNAKSKSTSCL